MTPRQKEALIDLLDASKNKKPEAWVTSEYLEKGSGRLLSTLIPNGLVEGRHVIRAPSADYRLTEEGRRLATQLKKDAVA